MSEFQFKEEDFPPLGQQEVEFGFDEEKGYRSPIQKSSYKDVQTVLFGDEVSVIWVSYDGLVTGSLELRNDNKNSYLRLLSEFGKPLLSPLGVYSVKYDDPKGPNKMAEPHYDGFLAGIASLNDDSFDTNFCYLETQFDDQELQPLQVPAVYQHSGLKTIVKTQDEHVRAKLNYQNAIHIYLLGPATESAVQQIQDIIQSNPGSTVIIHVQGEANGNPIYDEFMAISSDKDKTINFTANMFTAKVGMFPASFNFFSGEREMLKIRRMATKCYTVKVKNADRKEGKYIPQIYQDILDYIEKTILSYKQQPTQHQLWKQQSQLNNKLICQDSFDKDNAPAVAMLLLNSKNLLACTVDMISRRVYDVAMPKDPPSVLFSVVPAFKNILTDIRSWFGGKSPIGYVRSMDDAEWHGPVYAKNTSPKDENDLIRNGPLNTLRTSNLRQQMRLAMMQNVTEVLLRQNALTPGSELSFKETDETNTTDGEGPVSACGRAPFSEGMFKYTGAFANIMNVVEAGCGNNWKPFDPTPPEPQKKMSQEQLVAQQVAKNEADWLGRGGYSRRFRSRTRQRKGGSRRRRSRRRRSLHTRRG